MNKQRNILQVIDELIDTLSEIAVWLSNNLKEDVCDDLYALVRKACELIDWADSHFSDLRNEDISEVNNKFDELMHMISIVMASYNETAQNEKTQRAYHNLISNLEVLGRRNNELEHKYHLGLHQLKPSLKEGISLLKNGLNKLFEDIDWDFVEGRKDFSKNM